MPTNRLKYCAAIPLILAIGACTTTSGHQATVSRAGFDGANTVAIDPHSGICTSMAGPCIGLGAQWSSTTPDRAHLLVQLTGADFQNVQAVSVNIDGAVTPLAGSSGTNYTTEGGWTLYNSTRSFPVPLALIQQIAGARRVWVRVITPAGAVDGAIIDGSQDSKAYHAMHRFLSQVGSIHQQKPNN